MEEQRKLVHFANSKQFKKFSTVSLMYYCKRKNLLNCSLESWYKYLRLYGIDRRNKRFKKIIYRNGLRAKSVDEYWHIDITEIKFGEKSKAYLQVVVDNYSRMIVGWKLDVNKKMNLTYKTLMKSFWVASRRLVIRVPILHRQHPYTLGGSLGVLQPLYPVFAHRESRRVLLRLRRFLPAKAACLLWEALSACLVCL